MLSSNGGDSSSVVTAFPAAASCFSSPAGVHRWQTGGHGGAEQTCRPSHRSRGSAAAVPAARRRSSGGVCAAVKQTQVSKRGCLLVACVFVGGAFWVAGGRW